jgi:hypothetical protein
MFQRNVSHPSSGRLIASRALLAVCCVLVSCVAYSLTLKMEAIYFSEMVVDFHHITQHYIPEDRTLQSYCYENLKSKKGVHPKVCCNILGYGKFFFNMGT